MLVLSVIVLASTSCPTKEEYRTMIKEAVNDYFSYPSHEKLMTLQDMLKVYATHDFSKCLEQEISYEFTQTCSDGTAYGSCSVTKPLYCDNGSLVNDCNSCGCDANFGCQADGSCVALTCSDGTLYDQCSSTKPLFCQNGTLVNMCNICGCNEDQICKTDESCLNKVEAKQTILLIIEADKTLAQKALETAKNTPVKYPEKYKGQVEQQIEMAQLWLDNANKKTDAGEYNKAIDDYKKSWQHSQKAIDFANIPCPPNCVGKCGGASDGCGGSCNAACPAGQVCTNGSCTAKPKEEKPLIVKIVEAIVKVIVTIVKAIVKFFKKLFRW
ncbi:MAG: hypothetical protein Q8O03_00940 [Nanoarchaeota archaeon]|nr:hypothetical protein [Nanoarchaeota archaeon]